MANTKLATTPPEWRVDGNWIVKSSGYKVPWNQQLAETLGLGNPQPVEQTAMRFRVADKKKRRRQGQQ